MNKKTTSVKSQTDWARVDAMKDEDIDFSDIPEVTPEMFARAVVRRGLKPIERKAQLTLRVDNDVLEWFRSARARLPNENQRPAASVHGRT